MSRVPFGRRILPLLVVGLLSACASPGPGRAERSAPGPVKAEEPDPKSDYRAARSNPVTYQIDFRAVVTPPYRTKVLRVWMPIPPTDGAQEVTGSQFTTFPMKVTPTIGTEPVYGNTFAYFEFKDPQGAQIIRHRFTLKAWELRWNIDPAKVPAVTKWPAAFEPYLRNEQQAVVIDDRVMKISGDVVPARTTAIGDVTRLIGWVNSNLTYDHDKATRDASSQKALDQMAGHCSNFHGLCSSLSRALGYPTRMTYGINPFPKNSPTHCKFDAFIPGYGWVSFDASETKNLIAAIQKDPGMDDAKKAALVQAASDRLRSGFRDNTWYLQTRGSDYDLEPKASRKAPVVRTIYAEADGKPLPDPDPANRDQTEYAWMTAHEYVADRTVPYPFKDWTTLTK